MKKQRRTEIKRASLQAKVLRFMRLSKRISIREAGDLNGCSAPTISHYEQGRLDIPAGRVAHLVESYGYTMDDFNVYMNGKPLPVLNLRIECAGLLEYLDESKLHTVHAVLTSFLDFKKEGVKPL